MNDLASDALLAAGLALVALGTFVTLGVGLGLIASGLALLALAAIVAASS